MSKLWFFGDSYIADLSHIIEDTSWTHLVVKAFPDYESENLGKTCSSLDYLYYIYNNKRSEFKQGDVVILTLTALHRKFLNTEKRKITPSFMNSGFILREGKSEVVEENHEYYGFFVSELFNDDAELAKLDLFLDALQYDVLSKGIKIVVLPIEKKALGTKEHLIMGTSSGMWLKDVSRMEIEKRFGKNLRNGYYLHSPVKEYDNKLANHLSPENNKILAQKVINALNNNDKTIDLSSGWDI